MAGRRCATAPAALSSGIAREALLHRTGFYGDLLKLAEYVEKPGEAGSLLAALLMELNLPSDSIYPLQLEAFEWSNSLLPSYTKCSSV